VHQPRLLPAAADAAVQDAVHEPGQEGPECDPTFLHDHDRCKAAIPGLLSDLILHLNATDKCRERMERLITRIAMPLADCVKEGDDDDYEDSSAFENEGDESGLERDDEDKRTPSGEEEEDDSAPTPPPPKLIRRADQQVTTSP